MRVEDADATLTRPDDVTGNLIGFNDAVGDLDHDGRADIVHPDNDYLDLFGPGRVQVHFDIAPGVDRSTEDAEHMLQIDGDTESFPEGDTGTWVTAGDVSADGISSRRSWWTGPRMTSSRTWGASARPRATCSASSTTCWI